MVDTPHQILSTTAELQIPFLPEILNPQKILTWRSNPNWPKTTKEDCSSERRKKLPAEESDDLPFVQGVEEDAGEMKLWEQWKAVEAKSGLMSCESMSAMKSLASFA